DNVASYVNEEHYEYRLIWTTLINQYEFSQDVNIGFELFKLLCFFKYSLTNYRPYLREYINGLGFKSLSHYLGSFAQLASITLNYHPERDFLMLNMIVPGRGIDDTHLRKLTINSIIGTKSIQLFDLR